MDTMLIGSENSISNEPKNASTPKLSLSDRHDRYNSNILKDSVKGNCGISSSGVKSLGGKVKTIIDKPVSLTHSVKVYEDNDTTGSGKYVHCSRGVQTDDALLEAYVQSQQLHSVNLSTDSGNLSECFDQEAFDLMSNEIIPETYWKDIAEQRRLALNDTLEENKNLSFEIENLKEENRRLSDIAAKAQHLESILQAALSDDDDEDGDELDGNDKNDDVSNVQSKQDDVCEDKDSAL